MASRPITMVMTSSAVPRPGDSRANDLHLLRDCLTLGTSLPRKAPAKVRLEAELGPDLARRLVTSLSPRRR